MIPSRSTKLLEINMEEFIAKDSEGRNRVFVKAICSVCGTEYTRQKRHINETNTCSISCTNIVKGTSKLVECAHCNIKFSVKLHRFNSSKSGLFFCCREHKDLAQKYIKEIQPDHYGKGSGINTYRNKAFELLNHSCNRCGFNANKAALVVHHKDRDRDNNNIDNLEILCANCHAIEHWGQ